MARIIELEDTLNGRRVRAKVTASAFGMGPYVKLQIRVGFWWQTEDSMIPYNSANPNQPVGELVEWAIEVMWDRLTRNIRRQNDLDQYLGGTA